MHTNVRFVVGAMVVAAVCLFGGHRRDAGATAPLEEPAAQEDPYAWTPLFNGENLDGWYTFIDGVGRDQDPEGYFQVHDGMIHIMDLPVTDQERRFGYIATNEEYENYRLRFEYRWGEKRFVPRAEALRDSGVLYHFVGEDFIWPTSVECQVQETDTGDFWLVNNTTITAPVADPAADTRRFDPSGVEHTQTGGRIECNPEADYLTEWNSVEVIVRGDSGVHIVNGRINNAGWNFMQPNPDGEDPIPLTRGRILFQAEGAEVFYRNIEIQPIVERPVTALWAQGNWEGYWREEGAEDNGRLTAQVIALGNDRYRAVFTPYMGEETIGTFIADGQLEGDVVTVAGAVQDPDGNTFSIEGTLDGDQFRGTAEGGGDRILWTLEKVRLRPQSLGAEPPEGAVVLFDGSGFEHWQTRGGDTPQWRILDDGAMEVAGGGDILSTETYRDAQIHVEFRTPFMPEALGQGRGNSGVYVQGIYEVQVLDSFGVDSMDDIYAAAGSSPGSGCGFLYGQAAPAVNATLPPTEWQTYDITFRAAREGEPARITVVHNGILIHDNVEVGPTPGGTDGDPLQPGPLLLQDHGNLVQYRNIWFVPIEE